MREQPAHDEQETTKQTSTSRSAEAGVTQSQTGSAAHVLHLQRTLGNAAVARMIGDEQDEVQRSSVHGVLRSPGRPLDEPVRADMEARLGADFSDVRLHTGSTAARSAAEIGARAYTSGNHIVLGEGGADNHTLAHELTHVIQQRSGPVSGTDNGNGLRMSDPSDRFEREAEATARQVMSGRSPHIVDEPTTRGVDRVAGYVQRANHGFDDTKELEQQQWLKSGQSTFVSLFYKPTNTGDPMELGLAKSNKSVAHGSEHAEDVALRVIQSNLTMFSLDEPNELILTVTKSPCTSTARGDLPTTSNKPEGCTERLIGLVERGLTGAGGETYSFGLQLICRGLYAPQLQGYSQAEVLDASQAAIDEMRKKKITCSGDVRPSPAAKRFESR